MEKVTVEAMVEVLIPDKYEDLTTFDFINEEKIVPI